MPSKLTKAEVRDLASDIIETILDVLGQYNAQIDCGENDPELITEDLEKNVASRLTEYLI